jgi:hypothetical protein
LCTFQNVVSMRIFGVLSRSSKWPDFKCARLRKANKPLNMEVEVSIYLRPRHPSRLFALLHVTMQELQMSFLGFFERPTLGPRKPLAKGGAGSFTEDPQSLPLRVPIISHKLMTRHIL